MKKQNTSKRKSIMPSFTRLSATAISYSLAVISMVVINLINNGAQSAENYAGLIELFGAIVAVEFIDWLLSKLITKTVPYLIINFLVICAVLMAFFLLRGWIDYSIRSILTTIGAILVVFVAVYLILFIKNRHDAKGITEQLVAAQNENIDEA